jgi:hypothetical protein
VSSTHHPLRARAVVLKQGSLSFGVVSLDVLLIPDDVARDVRAQAGLNEVWTVATHTHSSFGGYDGRLIAELAGTGHFREAARKAVVEGALEALRRAAASAGPAEVELASAAGDLSVSRSGGASDERLTRVRFVREGTTVAQWLVLAAHPTFIPRQPSALDPDYPGAIAQDAATLVLQGAVGNAATNGDSLEAFAQQAVKELGALEGHAVEAPVLSVARAQLGTPAPDASRLVPSLFTMPGRNFICASAPKQAEVGVLRLGPLTLVAVPAEVTLAAAQQLEPAGARVVSVANGYLGYVEPADVVDRREGEARRQYYDRGLLDALDGAAKAALKITE